MSVARVVSSSALAVALAFAPGCASGEPRPLTTSGPMSFAADPPAQGATVFLRAQLPDPAARSRLVVDVVATAAGDLHGAAFRVTWDPEALSFVSAESGAPWSKQVLALAKEGSPGQLAVAWTEQGETGIDARGETTMGTLTFDVRGGKPTPLTFKAERSQLVDKKGSRIAAKWVGGSIAPGS